ncbi:MAG: methyltransferase domain-containing protein [Stellaceae bacterium]
MLKAEPRFQPEEIVSALYQAILERQPDPPGFAEFLRRLNNGEALHAIVGEFVASDEFRCKGVGQTRIEPLPANPIELDLAPAQRQAVWDHVAKVWSRLGRDDPYWSVVSTEEFHLANLARAGAIDQFYESGRYDIEWAENYLSRNGRCLPETGLCVDYGCGLGRTTLWLARRCARVLAVDVSQAHLDLAGEALAARGVTNVEFRLLRSRQDLDDLRGFDFFHSVLVLQHNPPPLIADILAAAFAGLNAGGCAFFQVPTFGSGYSWHYDRYIAEMAPAQQMEMHVLPQSAIFALAARAGVVPLEVEPDACTGIPDWLSNTFVFAKPGTDGPLSRNGR